jgi:hypothetical protein
MATKQGASEETGDIIPFWHFYILLVMQRTESRDSSMATKQGASEETGDIIPFWTPACLAIFNMPLPALRRLKASAVPPGHRAQWDIRESDSEIVFEHACKLGCEGIVSKRLDRRIGPAAPAVRREAIERALR